MPGMSEAVVQIAEYTVGKAIFEPGWRWSTHVGTQIGSEWCQTHHSGIVVTGRLGVTMTDGTTMEVGPDEVFDIPPEHDSYVIGDEPLVMVEWAGFLLRSEAAQDRVLCTLLFTDIVGSTEIAVRLGDRAWREALTRHHHALRSRLEQFRGTEVDTAGDGLLAMFEGPAIALRCADSIRQTADSHGLPVRIGVHVGEVELVGDRVRGIAVHEAARIMSKAGAGEILVSDMTKMLAHGAGVAFEDRGEHLLKGLTEPLRLHAFLGAHRA